MKHACHAFFCDNECPPRHLMCAACWRLVPSELQREVYRTVRQRGGSVDATWAPWWRAQAKAIDAVLENGDFDDDRRERVLARELAFADRLEARSA